MEGTTYPYGVSHGINLSELTSDGRRCVRAVTEQMLVVPETTADGETTARFRVYSESASLYLIDLSDAERPCDCPDMKHNRPEGGCKHLRRVEFLQRDTNVPLPDGRGKDATDYWSWFDDRAHAVKSEAAVLHARDGHSERAEKLETAVSEARDAAKHDRPIETTDDNNDDNGGAGPAVESGAGDVDRGDGIEADGGRETTLEAVERVDDNLHPSVKPGATLRLPTGERHVKLDPIRVELPTDLANAGIERAARYAVVDDAVRGVIGETSDGSLYHLKRRDGGLMTTPAHLEAPFIDDVQIPESRPTLADGGSA